MNPDLPRWDIVLNAWRLLIDNTGAVLRIAVLPFLLLVALHRLTAFAAPQGLAIVGWQLFHIVVFTVPVSLLLVPWYRLILSARWPELAERPAHWWYVAFMIRTLGLEIMLYAIQAPSAVAGILAMQSGGDPDPQLLQIAVILLVALPLAFYLYGRTALALPAAARGGDHGYGRSWRTTSGAGWRVATIIFMLWLAFRVFGGLLSGLPAEGVTPAPPDAVDSVISAAIDTVRELVLAAALALVYLHYTRPPVEDVFS